MNDNQQNKPIRWILLLVVALVVIVPLGMALAMTSADNSPNTDYHYGMMGSWGGAWWLMMLVPAAIVVLIVIVLVVALTDHPVQVVPSAQTYPAQYYPQYGPPQVQANDSLAILDRRLASGEITLEEHSRLRNELLRR